MAPHRIVTIGVYGFTAETFFDALVAENVDVFCDLRARRGVRGRAYAFANAQRLQAQLATIGIPYEHFPELAPTAAIRSAQHAIDRAAGVAKRERGELDPSFIAGYLSILATPTATAAIERIAARASIPALFCVERLPSACHRSLVAERLASGSVPVKDIVP